MKTLLKSFVNRHVIAISVADVCARILAYRAQKKSVHLVTLNAEMALAATRDKELARIILAADIVVADSIAVQWWLRLLHISAERIAGIDLARNLAQQNAFQPVALIGGRTGESAERAARSFLPPLRVEICERGPQLDPLSRPSEDALMARIRHSSVQLVLVGFGHGKQERWISAARLLDPYPRVWIGVGGAIDVWAGDVRRAPQFMRVSGLEWLWRVMVEPRRFFRIIRATVIFPIRALYEILLY